APYSLAGDLFDTPLGALFDGDSATACTRTLPDGTTVFMDGTPATPVGAVGSMPGCEAYQTRSNSYNKMTGRFVIDYKITENNLIYASYSRGYKSGGINPPLQPVFAVPESFKSE